MVKYDSNYSVLVYDTHIVITWFTDKKELCQYIVRDKSK